MNSLSSVRSGILVVRESANVPMQCRLDVASVLPKNSSSESANFLFGEFVGGTGYVLNGDLVSELAK